MGGDPAQAGTDVGDAGEAVGLNEPGDIGSDGPAASEFQLSSGVAAIDELLWRQRDLSAALANPATPSSHILAAIRALRQARQAATTEVEAAKQDLASVLTVRQEGLLLQFGVL